MAGPLLLPPRPPRWLPLGWFVPAGEVAAATCGVAAAVVAFAVAAAGGVADRSVVIKMI